MTVLIGRSLALCAHPYAAWRTRSVRTRCLLTLSYAAAGYVAMFAVLNVW